MSQILIIGAGLAGPALALFLKRAGIQASIYEAYGPGSASGSGFQISPNGMHILAELGLAEAVLAEAMPADWINFETHLGRRLARFENGPGTRYGVPAVVVSREVVHRLLNAEAIRQGIPIHYHKRLSDLSQDAQSVSARFEDGTQAQGDLLIGADGIHSPTRRLLFPKAAAPLFTGQLNIGGLVSLSRPHDDDGTTHMVFGPAHFLGYSRIDQDDPQRYMWWCNLPAHRAWSREDLEQQSHEAFRAELLERCRDWAGPVSELIARTPEITRTNTLTLPPLKAWSKGRALLLGDAAHGLDPASGQGASLALEDSLCLARHLREQAWPEAFARFEQERRPRVAAIALSAKRRASSKGRLGPVALWFRDQMMSRVVPKLAQQEQQWMYGYRLSWT